MLRMIGIEMFKLRKRWMPYIMLLLLLATIIIPLLERYLSGATQAEALVLRDAMTSTFTSVSGLGIILVAILAASMTGAEYGWGTLRQTLARGTSRNKYLTAKLLAIVIVVSGGVLAAILVGVIANIITGTLIEGIIDWNGFTGYFFASLGRTLVMLAVYMSMAVFFAMLMRSYATGMAVTVAWYIGESTIIDLLSIGNGWWKEATGYFIGYNINNLMTMNAADLSIEAAPWWQSCVILLTYMIVILTAAYYLFRRQDITA
ncbi:MAG: ABC transporter permease [Thermodesulfobacteriota bacterium]|nr:ABC transporter permease [Thermodesulfobacteriota bacterium]